MILLAILVPVHLLTHTSLLTPPMLYRSCHRQRTLPFDPNPAIMEIIRNLLRDDIPLEENLFRESKRRGK
jgi:hypothetical protein